MKMSLLTLLIFSSLIAGYGAIVSHIVSNKLVIAEHNRVRDPNHPLTGFIKLSIAAQTCVKQMLADDVTGQGHPCNPLNHRQGENIYTWLSKLPLKTLDDRKLIFEKAMKEWYAEHKYMTFSDSNWIMDADVNKIGHFTQVVWKSTKSVGCAVGSSATKTMVVCRYSPPGNKFTGSALLSNVPPVKATNKMCEDQEGCDFLDCFGEFAALARSTCPKKCNEC